MCFHENKVYVDLVSGVTHLEGLNLTSCLMAHGVEY